MKDATGNNALDAETAGFKARVIEMMGLVVDATRQLVDYFISDGETAADLARRLSIPKKLAWQMCRIARAEDVLVTVNFVPGLKPIRGLALAAQREGLDPPLVAAFIQAHESLDRLIEETAGDRNRFQTMLAGDARDPHAAADADHYHRTMVFKSYVHFFGMYAEHVSDLSMISDAEPGFRVDVTLRTVNGLCRLRPDAQGVMERCSEIDLAKPDIRFESKPLDEAAFREHGAPVLPVFCSRPVPVISIDYEQQGNGRLVEWGSGSVGIKHSVDVTTGIILRSPRVDQADGNEHGLRRRTRIGFPVKSWTQWTLLHLPGRKLLPPRLSVHLDPDASVEELERPLNPKMNIVERVEFFPPGSWGELPGKFAAIREKVAYICGIMKWNPADFAIYELTVEYPLLNSVYLSALPWV